MLRHRSLDTLGVHSRCAPFGRRLRWASEALAGAVLKKHSLYSTHGVIYVTWPFLAGMLLMLGISLASIYAQSAMRAYILGLGVWTRAEGDTNASPLCIEA